MRKKGTISGVDFRGGVFCPYNLAYKYILSNGDKVEHVYVNNMKQLREEVHNFNGREYAEYEEDQI